MAKKLRHVTITMGGFEINDDIKCIVIKLQRFCITLSKGKVFEGMMPATKINSFSIKVYAEHRFWLQIAFNIRSPTPVPTAYLHNFQIGQVNCVGQIVVK